MSWFRDTLSSVMGASSASSAPKADSEPGAKADDTKSVASAGSEWAEGVNHYFSGVAASVGQSLGKDSGFAFVERFTGSTEHAVDAKKELDDLSVACKLLHSGSADPANVWREWIKKLSQEPPVEFYDSATDDTLNFQTLLLRSSAVEASLGCVLRNPDVTKEEDSLILEVLDRCLMGEKEPKRRLLAELSKLAQNVDGTASHEQIERLVCEAMKQAKRDLRYEEALHEASTLRAQVREREQELRVLPELQLEALDGVEGVGDEDLKDRVSRSAELLDRNASMRHLVTVASSMMESRQKGSGMLEGLKGEIQTLKSTAANECAGVKQRSESTEKDKESLKHEAVATEQRLSQSEAALSEKLDLLLAKKRKLEEELEVVMGEILSTDQQLNETRRDLSSIARNAAAKEKSLAEHLQALSVQAQDYENELDALDDLGSFVELVQSFLSSAISGQLEYLENQKHEVLKDRLTFVLMHLRNQSAQLHLLQSCILFCHDELAATRARSSKISKLGIRKMVSEEEQRELLLEEKCKEAEERVLGIEQDALDIRVQIKDLSPAGPAMKHAGRDSETLVQLCSQIEEAVSELERLIKEVKGIANLQHTPDPGLKSGPGGEKQPPLSLNIAAALAQSSSSPEPIVALDAPAALQGAQAVTIAASPASGSKASPPIPPQPSVQELLRDSVSVDGGG
eukprot:CAMPEP_0181319786 /NCGR_PEP_ID=MMETSP1101-20121128/17763_1 /TAXON_ID=46948 /ORGANISM="Rhodomonas abbreviata, Strain Caron Lab Isolate" /LENGTH=685 /DNA_ID=CAMNT_0023427421 /DNA_START=223 /DNA_END=2277 /DNA_ORIENTATION=+